METEPARTVYRKSREVKRSGPNCATVKDHQETERGRVYQPQDASFPALVDRQGMSRKSRETILKRVREQKRREKAALKRERRLARKMAKGSPEEGEEGYEGEDEDEIGLGVADGGDVDTADEPIEAVVQDAPVEAGVEKS
jgi:hypothetical protein